MWFWDIYPAWHSLNFLDLWFSVWLQFGEIVSHYCFKYFCSFVVFFPAFPWHMLLLCSCPMVLGYSDLFFPVFVSFLFALQVWRFLLACPEAQSLPQRPPVIAGLMSAGFLLSPVPCPVLSSFFLFHFSLPFVVLIRHFPRFYFLRHESPRCIIQFHYGVLSIAISL